MHGLLDDEMMQDDNAKFQMLMSAESLGPQESGMPL
jgi:hypothetical protein